MTKHEYVCAVIDALADVVNLIDALGEDWLLPEEEKKVERARALTLPQDFEEEKKK